MPLFYEHLFVREDDDDDDEILSLLSSPPPPGLLFSVLPLTPLCSSSHSRFYPLRSKSLSVVLGTPRDLLAIRLIGKRGRPPGLQNGDFRRRRECATVAGVRRRDAIGRNLWRTNQNRRPQKRPLRSSASPRFSIMARRSIYRVFRLGQLARLILRYESNTYTIIFPMIFSRTICLT